MGLFNNLFACFCGDSNNDKTDVQTLKQDISLAHIELKSIISNIEKDISHLFSKQKETNNDIKRLEDKIANHFIQLHHKVDNSLLLSSKLEETK